MPGGCCPRIFSDVSVSMSRPNMARRDALAMRAAVVLTLLAALSVPLVVAAAPRTADPLETAKSDIRLKKFAAAATELQRLAVAGNSEAQYVLGTFYLNGLSGPRDPAKAREWLEKSASQGNARAAFSLSVLLAQSDPPNREAAEHWLARSRELGFVPAAQPADRSAPSLELRTHGDLSDPQIRAEAFWLAAEEGDVAELKALTNKSMIDARDAFGRGALAKAAEAGRTDAVSFLLSQGAAVDARDSHGMTPLMLAARAGSLGSVDALLKQHADANAVDQSHNTPLMYASVSAKLEVVEHLLAAGATPGSRNVQDWSALDFALVSGTATEIATRLRESGATALRHNAVSNAELTSITRPVPPQLDLYAGWPDVAVAAVKTEPSLLNAVLARGADSNAAVPGGSSTLIVASLAGSPRAVETLLSSGARFSQTDRRGDTALMHAIRARRQDVVEVLLGKGVSPEEHTDTSEPTLVAAVKAGSPSIVHSLLAAHARPNSQDARGENALMLAARVGDMDTLRQLLDAGASTELEDKGGRTALWNAAHAGKLEAAQLLIEHGANVNHADASGVP